MAYVPIEPEYISRISYVPISIPVHTRNMALSERFIDFVLSPYGKSVYAKYGYITDRKKAETLAPGAQIGGEYTLPPAYFYLLKSLWDKG